MPLFEFECNDCGHEFEELKSFTDTKLPTCPNCKQVNTKKLLSTSSLGKTSNQGRSDHFQAPACSTGGG